MKRIKSGERKQYTLNISQILVTVPIQIKSQVYEYLLSVRMTIEILAYHLIFFFILQEQRDSSRSPKLQSIICW